MAGKVKAILEKHKAMMVQKQPLLSLYQLIGEYVNLRKQSFTETNTFGAFVIKDIYDNTAGKNNAIMASALIFEAIVSPFNE